MSMSCSDEDPRWNVPCWQCRFKSECKDSQTEQVGCEMNKDVKYSLGIMQEELKSEFICPEIKYAFKASIKALEKQIPKKPRMYVGEYEHERYPLCPACGGELMPNGEKYCSDCGQKILWED